MIDPIDILKSDCAEAFAENDRLRALNAELLEALKNATFALALIAQADGNEDCLKATRAAIAKAENQS